MRDARLADAPGLADVFRVSWSHAYQGVIPHNHLDGIIRRRKTTWWRSAIKSDERVLVLEFDKTLIGYATCGAARSRGASQGEIYEIYLLPDYQGLGFGEYLFEACRAHLDEQRFKGLLVWALAENTSAISFYWQHSGRPIRAIYERIGGERLEKIAFGWD
ncbi:MAG TPA: GNAT family N-acetyltransferase [Hyphomicrobiaceae bacterium]|nr:GNAT family N-acetyltransferase [Hyphomicrobiaceae bacterium]